MGVNKKKPSEYQKIIESIAGNTTYTTAPYYKFPKVKDSTNPQSGFNEMADLLMLPVTKEGYRYILSVVDIWSNYFDIEPMKTKTAKATLDALLAIFKRHYVSIPKASMSTDNGTEFKEVFNKWLIDHNIYHKLCLPDRHKQLANVENLNRQVGKIIMTYLTNKEIEIGKPYHEWMGIIPDIRKELNKFKTHPENLNPFTTPLGTVDTTKPPKYQVGELVHYALSKPDNAYGKFRSGDRRFSIDTKKISFILYYSSSNPYRYLIDGVPNVSFAEAELIPAKGKEQTYIIHKIIGKKKEKGKTFYLVWWKKYKKSQSTWESKEKLIEDGAEEYIKQYEDSI